MLNDLLKKVFHENASQHQKMKFPIKDCFSKCDQIRKKLRIWSHLLQKFLNGKLACICFVMAMKSLRKGVLRNFAKFTGHFIKFFIKRLWHRYFPVNFAKFLRKPLTPPVAASILALL